MQKQQKTVNWPWIYCQFVLSLPSKQNIKAIHCARLMLCGKTFMKRTSYFYIFCTNLQNWSQYSQPPPYFLLHPLCRLFQQPFPPIIFLPIKIQYQCITGRHLQFVWAINRFAKPMREIHPPSGCSRTVGDQYTTTMLGQDITLPYMVDFYRYLVLSVFYTAFYIPIMLVWPLCTGFNSWSE